METTKEERLRVAQIAREESIRKEQEAREKRLRIEQIRRKEARETRTNSKGRSGRKKA